MPLKLISPEIILQMSSSITNISEAVLKSDTMCFIGFSSIMPHAFNPIRHCCLFFKPLHTCNFQKNCKAQSWLRYYDVWDKYSHQLYCHDFEIYTDNIDLTLKNENFVNVYKWTICEQ